jgi:23S rRNA maturation-related 3'-5' exoribonuclease YhaM
MELDAEENVSENLPNTEPDTEKVSDAQMEAALERVIKKMFYEKIDGILVEVIEKTVTRELERLKSILLEDEAGNKK